MALRECPTCRTMVRASAKTCRSCGHEFAGAVLARTHALRCPLCGELADAGAGACKCGYDFSSRPIDLRVQLLRRKRYAWFWIAGGLFIIVGAGVGLTTAPLPILAGVALAAAGAALIARGIRSMSWTRGELRQLEARDKALPAARVVE